MGRGTYDGKLLVADNGKRKQVLVYDLSGKPHIVEKIGVKGGIGADYTSGYDFPAANHSNAYPAGNYPPGVYHPLKFWTLTGVGMDQKSRLFVSTSEAAAGIRCFKKSEGKWILDWKLENYIFVDNADFHRTTDGKDIYGVQEHFKMNYSAKGQGAEWTIHSLTVDAEKYPNDPRGKLWIKAGHEHGLTSSLIRHIEGKRFLFVNGMTCQWTWVFRFIEGTEIAVPSVCISNRHRIYDIKPDVYWPLEIPTKGGEYIWRDANGDVDFQKNEYLPTEYGHTTAWYVDLSGAIWGAKGSTLHRYMPDGLDKSGNPVYNDQHVKTYQIDGIDNIGKVIFQKDEDRLVLLTTGCRELAGGTVYVVNNWSKGNRSTTYVCELKGENPSSIDAAGDYLFEVGWESRAKCWISNLTDGSTVGTMEPYGDAGKTEHTGWVDIGFGITAYQRSNAEYDVLVEEDGWGKILLYRWCPSGNCAEQ